MLGVCALSLGLGACSSEIVEQVEAMADKACQCRDSACADTVERQFYEFQKANTRVQGSQSERDEIVEHHNRMRECFVRVRSMPGASPGQGGANGTVKGEGESAGKDEGAVKGEAAGKGEGASKDQGAGQAGEKEKSQ
jgi:hypothetical protein